MKRHYTSRLHFKSKRTLQFILIFLLGGFLFALPFQSSIFSSFSVDTDAFPPDSTQTKRSNPADSLYRATVVNAQNLYNQKRYSQALAEFEKAQKMKPGEKNLEEPIEKLRALVAEQKAKDQEGQKYINSGDTYFKAKDYLNAKSSYQQAIDLNPNDPIAKDKMKQTMEIIRSQKAQNILYDVTVANAEKMFQAKDYAKAKAEFEKASKILPDDKYAKERINTIIKIMVDQQAANENYAKAIASADKFYTAKGYQNALADYQKASTIKPDEKYPKDRIAELTTLLNDIKAKDEAYAKSIAAADKLFQDGSYLNSKKEYQNALTIKPQETYPVTRIKQIDEIIAGKQRADSEYERLVNLADSLYIEKKFIGAKANYQQALKIKPNESYPKEMLTKVDNQIVNQDANQKAVDEAYLAAIAAADKALAEKSYSRSKTEYQNALSIKPNEQYPKDKIGEIDAVLAALEKQKSLDDQYNTIIVGAEKAFAEKSYEVSRAEFEKASKLKPTEKYPKDKISEITKLISEESQAKSRAEQYNRAISLGDKLYGEKSFEESLNQYKAAALLRPDEAYPKEKIADLDKILAAQSAQKALDEQYHGLIVNADKLLTAKSYTEAKSEYSKALAVKPQEDYPQKRIAEIDAYFAGLADAKTKKEKYDQLIVQADKLLADKNYLDAKVEYQRASDVKPEEAYPKTKITEIETTLALIEKQKSLDEQYQNRITTGDKLLSEKSYAEAKKEYQAALLIKAAESYPKEKIVEIDNMLAEISKQKALDDQYKNLIQKADGLLAVKSIEGAKAEYLKAQTLKPEESYPKEKIAEIERLMASAAELKVLNEKYQSTIGNADKLFAAKSYEGARTEYANASTLKPEESYPKGKIAEIDKILGDLAAAKLKDEEYSKAISTADQLLAEKRYDDAKNTYNQALTIKAGEKYPVLKIGEIDKVLAEIAKQKSQEEQYQQLISSGDKLLEGKSYADAKKQFQTALTIKPTENYPKDKIAEIDQALAEIAQKKALDDQYAAILVKADGLFASKSFELAKAEYQKAITLNSIESYPKEKIAEIDRLLADAAALKALQEKYQAMITNGSKLMVEKNYVASREEFVNASTLKPEESLPKEKIAEIDKIMGDIAAAKAKEEQYKSTIEGADKLLLDKHYLEAKDRYNQALTLKPGEAYPTQKIGEIDKVLADLAKQKALDDQYQQLISSADKSLESKSYSEAKKQYQSALALKPTEKYPQDKISVIDQALAEIARLKALDDQYVAIITKADGLLTAKSLDLAKQEYQKALTVKPGETYPKDKIAEIDKLVADAAALKALNDTYQGILAKADGLFQAKNYEQAKLEYSNALKVKPEEQYPKEKLAEIDKALALIAEEKAKLEQYQAAIQKADKLLLDKTYDGAKTEYANASLIKPGEAYPKTKIAEIDKILDDAAKKKAAEEARIKAIDDQYAGKLAEAEKLLSDKSYDQAKAAFVAAGKIKPDEKAPTEKIKEIDGILAALAKQKAIDDQYKASISKADNFFESKSYDLAKNEYTNALTIKAGEQYPKDKIAEIEGILADLKAKDDAYKAAIAKADELLAKKSYEEARGEYQNASAIKPNEQYPKTKMADINELLMVLKGKKQTYDDLVKNGDDLFSQKDFYKSKEMFQQASGIFPEEGYPKQKLTRLNSIIDSIYRANKGLYDKAVADGDKYFQTLIYDKAIDSYTEASNYLPNERYPKEMIGKIKKAIAENALVDVLTTTMVVTSGDQKQVKFAATNPASRKNNYLYIKIKNLSDKPINVMVRYGKDQGTSGGAVIKNLPGDGNTYDRLISVRDQDPWYRNDNNWIGLLPQGGDIEVSFIQISRATQ